MGKNHNSSVKTCALLAEDPCLFLGFETLSVRVDNAELYDIVELNQYLIYKETSYVIYVLKFHEHLVLDNKCFKSE